MKHPALWQVSVATSPAAEDAVTELLATALGQPASSYTDFGTGRTVVAVYPSAKADFSREKRAALRTGLEQIRACGLPVGPGTIMLAKVRGQDWAESWKRHFKPIQIGSALLIKPSWSKQRPRRGAAVVVLDPGLSFGTGRHPTTAFCLRQLAARRRPNEAQSVLDIGTGSGILAIAAAKLGFTPVDAFDSDPEAVRIALANARRNGVARQIHFFREDLTRWSSRRPKQYSIVCANLISSLLLAERGRILARLQPGGALVLAGILDSEFARVQRAYESAGLRLRACQTRDHWRSGAFAWRR